VSVTPNAARASVPAGIPVLDASGKTLVAGLMDSHWHYWDPFVGGALLARGVTMIRDPGVAVSMSMNFKEAIALGALPGPTIYTAGPLIDGVGGYHPYVDVELDRPEAAAPLVRALKAQGVDALKVYFMLEPPVLAAVIAEAKQQGLPVTGHIGVRTGWMQAMRAGIDGFSHVRVWKDLAPPEIQPTGADESLDGTRAPVARMQADWSAIDPDGPAATALIDSIVRHRVALDPTLAIQQIGDGSRSRFSLEEFAVARQSYDRMARFVKRAFDAGVPILAGTDDGSLFEELDAYAAAGIPPADVIRTATVNGARWLGRADDVGTIEPGKRANLVLVDGDPLRNISDMRKITAVVQDGRVVVRR
jgi:imidazolonepropionase-like amidohydrolase